MLDCFAAPKKIWIFGVMTVFMFIVVMYVNALIDKSDGSSILLLQVSFFKEKGIEIVKSWGAGGAGRFVGYIFADYVYAFSYTAFFIAILGYLIKQTKQSQYRWSLFVPIIAGSFDFLENSLEIVFVLSPDTFPKSLFFIHSVIAVIKWMMLPVVLYAIVKLLLSGRKI